jgi:hypothetical protein
LYHSVIHTDPSIPLNEMLEQLVSSLSPTFYSEADWLAPHHRLGLHSKENLQAAKPVRSFGKPTLPLHAAAAAAAAAA